MFDHPDPLGEREFVRMLAVLAAIAIGVWAIVRNLSEVKRWRYGAAGFWDLWDRWD